MNGDNDDICMLRHSFSEAMIQTAQEVKPVEVAAWGEQRVIALNILPTKEILIIGDTKSTIDTTKAFHYIPKSEVGNKISLLPSVSIAGCDLMLVNLDSCIIVLLSYLMVVNCYGA